MSRVRGGLRRAHAVGRRNLGRSFLPDDLHERFRPGAQRLLGAAAIATANRYTLASVIAALAFTGSALPAWSQCASTDPATCGAPGGVGGHSGRNNNGGSGNGTGGDATVFNPNSSESTGSTASNGTGGNGANGVFDVDAVNLTSTGGTGGLVGAIGSAGVATSVTGGMGGTGEAAPSGSYVGGGGGGGGAGVLINDGSSAPAVSSGTTLAGGAGGAGGDATAASNADPGAGGGGGAGVIIGSGAGSVSLTNSGTLKGGAGGAGGNGGYAGSGGGGGDGLLVLGAGAVITNATGGTITGGAGGSPGTFQDGQGQAGGYGGGGAGVNLVGASASLNNSGTITGGGAGVSPVNSAQTGTPGVGVRAWGGATVVTSGAIVGGSNSSGQADSVLFSGGGNQLTIEAGATFTGNIVSTSGSTNGGDTLTLGGSANGSFNVGLVSGFANDTKTGTSTWTLTGTSTSATPWTVTDGLLNFSSVSNFGTGTITLNGGGLQWATGTTTDISGSLAAIGSNGGTFDTNGNNVTFSTGLTGTGGITKQGSGTLTLNAQNSFTGATTVNAGTLAIGSGVSNGNTLSSSTGMTIASGATFDISATTIAQSVSDLSGVAGSVVNLGSNTLGVGTTGSSTFAGTIEGTGGFLKMDGSGTLTLSGANTYSGGTIVSDGMLQLSGTGTLGGNTGSLTLTAGTVDLGGTTQTQNGGLTMSGGTLQNGTLSSSATFALTGGTISTILAGSGGLSMSGGGTGTLSGANTYTGATNINAGTLALGGSGSVSSSSGVSVAGGATFDISASTTSFNQIATLSGAGTVQLGANSLVFTNASTTFSGSIQDGGNFGGIEVQHGTLTLTGSNTYTNATQIGSGATLALKGGGAIANSAFVSFLGGGTLDISQTTAGATVGGLFSGPTATVDLGSQTLTINGGSGPFEGVIQDGGLGDGTGGSLALVGNGTSQTLSGANTYTGATTIGAGATLQVTGGTIAWSSGVSLTGSGATFDISSASPHNNQAVQNLSGVAGSNVFLGNSVLTVNNSTATTFAGAIQDGGNDGGTGGSLTKTGSGALTLDGVSTYTGGTTVAGGTLEVGDINSPQASIAGNVTVDPGATLAGHGTIGGGVTNLGGTLSPGGTIGTLTLGGNYTQGSSGTLSIEVSPTAASKLVVGGAASLGGTLALVFDPGTYTSHTYTLLTASSISGTFSTVTGTNPSGLAQSILYESDPSVVLQLSGTVTPTNDTIYPAVTSTAILTAQQMNGIILDRVGQRAAGVADGEVAALGGSMGSPVQVAQGNAAVLTDAAQALPQALGSEGGWFRGVGGFASLNGNSTAPGFTSSTGGFVAGYDRPIAPNVYLGVAGGYLYSAIGEHSTSSGTEDSARVAVYVGALLGPGLLSATAGYAHDWLGTERGLATGTASENHGADEATAAAQWSLPQPIQGLLGGIATLTPKAGLQFVHLSEGSFAETGAGGFDLSNSGHGTDSLQPYVGAALSQKYTTASGTVITPEVRLGYLYEAFDTRLLTVTAADGAAFPVTGVTPSRSQVTAGIGFTMVAAPNLSIYANYDAVLPTGNTTEQVVQGGLRFRF